VHVLLGKGREQSVVPGQVLRDGHARAVDLKNAVRVDRVRHEQAVAVHERHPVFLLDGLLPRGAALAAVQLPRKGARLQLARPLDRPGRRRRRLVLSLLTPLLASLGHELHEKLHEHGVDAVGRRAQGLGLAPEHGVHALARPREELGVLEPCRVDVGGLARPAPQALLEAAAPGVELAAGHGREVTAGAGAHVGLVVPPVGHAEALHVRRARGGHVDAAPRAAAQRRAHDRGVEKVGAELQAHVGLAGAVEGGATVGRAGGGGRGGGVAAAAAAAAQQQEEEREGGQRRAGPRQPPRRRRRRARVRWRRRVADRAVDVVASRVRHARRGRRLRDAHRAVHAAVVGLGAGRAAAAAAARACSCARARARARRRRRRRGRAALQRRGDAAAAAGAAEPAGAAQTRGAAWGADGVVRGGGVDWGRQGARREGRLGLLPPLSLSFGQRLGRCRSAPAR